MSVFDLDALQRDRHDSGRAYLEFLRAPALSAGMYELPVGAQDPQQPHTEDEIYSVVRGRAQIRIGDRDHAVGPGSIVYVPAKVEHRFHSITEALTVLVVFAPAEYSERE